MGCCSSKPEDTGGGGAQASSASAAATTAAKAAVPPLPPASAAVAASPRRSHHTPRRKSRGGSGAASPRLNRSSSGGHKTPRGSKRRAKKATGDQTTASPLVASSAAWSVLESLLDESNAGPVAAKKKFVIDASNKFDIVELARRLFDLTVAVRADKFKHDKVTDCIASLHAHVALIKDEQCAFYHTAVERTRYDWVASALSDFVAQGQVFAKTTQGAADAMKRANDTLSAAGAEPTPMQRQQGLHHAYDFLQLAWTDFVAFVSKLERTPTLERAQRLKEQLVGSSVSAAVSYAVKERNVDTFHGHCDRLASCMLVLCRVLCARAFAQRKNVEAATISDTMWSLLRVARTVRLVGLGIVTDHNASIESKKKLVLLSKGVVTKLNGMIVNAFAAVDNFAPMEGMSAEYNAKLSAQIRESANELRTACETYKNMLQASAGERARAEGGGRSRSGSIIASDPAVLPTTLLGIVSELEQFQTLLGMPNVDATIGVFEKLTSAAEKIVSHFIRRGIAAEHALSAVGDEERGRQAKEILFESAQTVSVCVLLMHTVLGNYFCMSGVFVLHNALCAVARLLSGALCCALDSLAARVDVDCENFTTPLPRILAAALQLDATSTATHVSHAKTATKGVKKRRHVSMDLERKKPEMYSMIDEVASLLDILEEKNEVAAAELLEKQRKDAEEAKLKGKRQVMLDKIDELTRKIDEEKVEPKKPLGFEARVCPSGDDPVQWAKACQEYDAWQAHHRAVEKFKKQREVLRAEMERKDAGGDGDADSLEDDDPINDPKPQRPVKTPGMSAAEYKAHMKAKFKYDEWVRRHNMRAKKAKEAAQAAKAAELAARPEVLVSDIPDDDPDDPKPIVPEIDMANSTIEEKKARGKAKFALQQWQSRQLKKRGWREKIVRK